VDSADFTLNFADQACGGARKPYGNLQQHQQQQQQQQPPQQRVDALTVAPIAKDNGSTPAGDAMKGGLSSSSSRKASRSRLLPWFSRVLLKGASGKGCPLWKGEPPAQGTDKILLLLLLLLGSRDQLTGLKRILCQLHSLEHSGSRQEFAEHSLQVSNAVLPVLKLVNRFCNTVWCVSRCHHC